MFIQGATFISDSRVWNYQSWYLSEPNYFTHFDMRNPVCNCTLRVYCSNITYILWVQCSLLWHLSFFAHENSKNIITKSSLIDFSKPDSFVIPLFPLSNSKLMKKNWFICLSFFFRSMKELYSLDWEESGEMGLWDQECFSLFPVWIRYIFLNFNFVL